MGEIDRVDISQSDYKNGILNIPLGREYNQGIYQLLSKNNTGRARGAYE
jgi:hypothetical protein